MNDSQPRRRWFQFGLRTLFVVVTVLAAFIAYHVNWIRQRHMIMTGVGPRKFAVTETLIVVDSSGLPSSPVAPGLLWLFGERGYGAFAVDFLGPREFSPYAGPRLMPRAGLRPDEKAEIERMESFFPESRVFVVAP